MKICKDCRTEWEALPEPKGPVTYRPRPIVADSGGRCATHWGKEKKRRKGNAHEKRVQKVYGLGPGQYEVLYDYQGGRCAICCRATGASRKLSVDHEHESGLVRGLLCRPCNSMLGHLRDDPATALWVYRYLTSPPAWELGYDAIHEEKRND